METLKAADGGALELDGARIVMRRVDLPAGGPQAIRTIESGDGIGGIDGEAALVEGRARLGQAEVIGRRGPEDRDP